MKKLLSLNNIRERYTPLSGITLRVFLVSAASFFLSSMMSTIGGIVDGFIIAHTMETAAVGALSLTSPVWFLSAVIYSIFIYGAQPRITMELAKGNQPKAREIFSMTIITGTLLAALMGLFMSGASGLSAQLLGAPPSSPAYEPCMAYLKGLAFGMPAYIAGSLLSNGIQLEGSRKWLFVYAAVLTACNIGLDTAVALMHGDMFWMGITTSISYWIALGIYVFYYLHSKDSILKPELCKVSIPLIASVALAGLPMGVRKITAVIRSLYLNHLLAASSTPYGVAAYNVQVQVSYLTNDLFMAIAATMAMLLGFYYAEENKKALRYTVTTALLTEIIFGLAITLLLQNPAVYPKISWFYLGDSPESINVANAAVYYFAAGLLGQAISSLFAVYLQSLGRILLSNLVYILSEVVLVVLFVETRLAGLPAAVSDSTRSAEIFRSVSNAQLWMLVMIPFVIMFVNVSRKRRPETPEEMILMLPKDYGSRKDEELNASPRNVEQVLAFSEQAYDFCLSHGAGKREAYYISLAAEEMATNILKHGFKDKGRHSMELRLIHKHHSFMLRIRDDSHIFDPIKKMAAISSIHDPSRYIGLRMVMKMASNVTYTSTLKLNNLVVEIEVPRKPETETAGA